MAEVTIKPPEALQYDWHCAASFTSGTVLIGAENGLAYLRLTDGGCFVMNVPEPRVVLLTSGALRIGIGLYRALLPGEVVELR